MTKTKHLFIFDFDGVVCDSTDECMVTSWNAWQKWSGKESFRNNINEFSEEEQNDFRPYRYYVKGAGDYYVLRRLISEMRVNSIKNSNDLEIYNCGAILKISFALIIGILDVELTMVWVRRNSPRPYLI